MLNQSFFNYFLLLLAGFTSLSCGQSSSIKGMETVKDSEHIVTIQLPEPLPVSKKEAERIVVACQRWYDSVLLYKGFNGGMIVARYGTIVYEKYSGTSHIPGNQPINGNTSLHVASVSKTFTAMAVLKLWQEGKINIDDEYSKYFPSFNYPGVTIRTLLNHRSGLPNYTYFMENLGWDQTKFVSNEDVLNYLINFRPLLVGIVSPNTHFSYCNTNYALLALLISKVTGFSYPAYMKNTIFAPLQMKNTFVFSLADSTTVPPSYDWKGRLMSTNFLDSVYGDKNIYSTPRDMLIWDRAINAGKLVNPSILEQAYAPYSNEHPGIKNYGLGWRMNIYPTGKKIIFHNGWWHGSNAAFIRLLQDSATIIVIGNKFNRSIYGARVLANLFGDYYDTGEDEEENGKPIDSLNLSPPKAQFPILVKPSVKDSLYRKKFRDLNEKKPLLK